MSWKKHMVAVTSSTLNRPTTPKHTNNSGAAQQHSNYSSYLPEVYSGQANRLQRYAQYDDMDRDSLINLALDTIADFCTQSEEHSDEMFNINFDETPNDTEVEVIKTVLKKWIKINNFKSRMWSIFRNTIKYGDQFFIRDPETWELLWIDPFNLDAIKVDESKGREPIEFMIRNLDYNKQAKLGTKITNRDTYANAAGNVYNKNGANALGNNTPFSMYGSHAGTTAGGNVSGVEASAVVHASLNPGTDANWPFGKSVLESVFKEFKQKELLEDAVIIYRVQRAPERRVFKIDVGEMNPTLANAHVERVKNEVHQRRIPNRNGNGTAAIDAAYNPLSMLEDYYFGVNSEGRGSSVDVLPGGDLTGDIGDLEYFNRKLKEGLRIPNSYLPGDDSAMYNDGRSGTAMVQEYRFNKYCMRLQSLLAPTFDKEFKAYLKESGFNIDNELFNIEFNPPQNFSAYRQIELDKAQIDVYAAIAENTMLSERWKMMRYLGMTEEEIIENERMWMEENPDKVKNVTGSAEMTGAAEAATLSSVGIATANEGGNDDFTQETSSEETTIQVNPPTEPPPTETV